MTHVRTRFEALSAIAGVEQEGVAALHGRELVAQALDLALVSSEDMEGDIWYAPRKA